MRKMWAIGVLGLGLAGLAWVYPVRFGLSEETEVPVDEDSPPMKANMIALTQPDSGAFYIGVNNDLANLYYQDGAVEPDELDRETFKKLFQYTIAHSDHESFELPAGFRDGVARVHQVFSLTSPVGIWAICINGYIWSEEIHSFRPMHLEWPHTRVDIEYKKEEGMAVFGLETFSSQNTFSMLQPNTPYGVMNKAMMHRDHCVVKNGRFRMDRSGIYLWKIVDRSLNKELMLFLDFKAGKTD